MTLLSHNEQVVTGTFNFPAGPANVTNLVIGSVLLFLSCTFLPFIPSIHVPFTSFNLATALSISSIFGTGYYMFETYRRIPKAIALSLPGVLSFGIGLGAWWFSQPHFLNRFTFMGCVTPMICYIWGVILGKFTDHKPTAKTILIPLACSLINVYLHSTVIGFFFTCGLFVFAPLYFCNIVRSVTHSLNMKHWWDVQLDSEVDKQQEINRSKSNAKSTESEATSKKSKEEILKEKEEQKRIEAEEKEKRMIADEKKGFLTVGKNGKIVHPKKHQEETETESTNSSETSPPPVTEKNNEQKQPQPQQPNKKEDVRDSEGKVSADSENKKDQQKESKPQPQQAEKGQEGEEEEEVKGEQPKKGSGISKEGKPIEPETETNKVEQKESKPQPQQPGKKEEKGQKGEEEVKEEQPKKGSGISKEGKPIETETETKQQPQRDETEQKPLNDDTTSQKSSPNSSNQIVRSSNSRNQNASHVQLKKSDQPTQPTPTARKLIETANNPEQAPEGEDVKRSSQGERGWEKA
jgi:hypothetical protein